MRWLKVQVRAASEAEEAVAHMLRTAGANGVIVENDGGEGILTAFLPESRHGAVEQIEQQVQMLTEHGLEVGAARVTSEWVSDEDWAENWKRDYKPIALGRRLLVKPAWLQDPSGSENRLIIELDPGMAFGTGYHPTTALCLEALDDIVSAGDVVVDIGTGSGILAIAAARLGAERVVAVDTLAETVPIATANCERNGVEDIVTVGAGSVDLAAELLGGAQADLIVVNILARVIRRLAPEFRAILRPGGKFIFSGIIEHAAEELTEQLRDHGLDVHEDRRQDEWSCLIGRLQE